MTDFLHDDDYPTTPRHPGFDPADALGGDDDAPPSPRGGGAGGEGDEPTHALAVLDPKAQAQADRLLALGRRIDLDLPDGEAALWEMAIEMENQSAINDAKRGLVYLALKARLGHGEFLPALEGRGITRFRASEAMRIAAFLLQVGDQNSNVRLGAHLNPERLFQLPKKKLLALASVPLDVLDRAVDQGELDLDEVALMPPQHLRDEVRRLRYQAETDRNQIAALSQKAQLAEHNLSAAMFSPEALAAREEALHGQGAAIATIDQLDMVLANLADPMRAYRNADERAACASVLWLSLGSLQARLTQVLERYQELLPEYASTDLDSATRAAITREEAHLAAQHLGAFLNKAKVAADLRAVQRQQAGAESNPVPSARRGRPKGATDKAPRKGRSGGDL